MFKRFKSSKFKAGKVSVWALVFVTAFTMLGGAYFFVQPAEGANPTGRSDTLSTPAPGVKANHTIAFTLNAADTWNIGETVIINFADTFDTTIAPALAITDPLDYDITVGGTEELVVAGTTCATQDAIEITTLNTTTDTFTFTACGSYTPGAAGAAIVIEIGTHASSPTAGDSQIQNPAKVAAAGTADVLSNNIGGTVATTFSGDFLTAIIEGVGVSASVNESMTFTMAQGAACAGDTGTPAPTSINASVTATTVPFGVIESNIFYVGCQDMTISTNAATGYNVTAQEDTNLRDATLADANDTILDTGCDAGPCTQDTSVVGQVWALEDASYGFGYVCENAGVGTPCRAGVDAFTEYHHFACASADADDCTVGVSEAAQIVLTGISPVSVNLGRIHYKLAVSPLQRAGTYSNTITYIATGTF